MKNSYKCYFLVIGEWQKHYYQKHHQRDGFFDGVCYDVLSVRMLELIFVAYFCSFFCFFLDYVFFEGNEGKSSL